MNDDLIQRTHDAIDAILRGQHDGWDKALDALRCELRRAATQLPQDVLPRSPLVT